MLFGLVFAVGIAGALVGAAIMHDASRPGG
jgi:hypothetical protein